MGTLHSQILVPWIVRSVSPQLEDKNALKCRSNNFPKTLIYLVIMENLSEQYFNVTLSSNWGEEFQKSIKILSHVGENSNDI